MLRKGLVGAAMALLTLGSAAMADDSAVSGSLQMPGSSQVESNIPVDLARAAINPVVFADDQSAAAAPAAAATPSGQPEGAIMWGLDQIPGFASANADYLHLSITGNRLVFDIRTEAGEPVVAHLLSLSPLRRMVKYCWATESVLFQVQ